MATAPPIRAFGDIDVIAALLLFIGAVGLVAGPFRQAITELLPGEPAAVPSGVEDR